jgi:hypothetical protein
MARPFAFFDPRVATAALGCGISVSDFADDAIPATPTLPQFNPEKKGLSGFNPGVIFPISAIRR